MNDLTEDDVMVLAFLANIAAHGLHMELQDSNTSGSIPERERQQMIELLDKVPAIFNKVEAISQMRQGKHPADLAQMGVPTIN